MSRHFGYSGAPIDSHCRFAMNVFAILRDAWFFYSRQFIAIARLCLPLILLESATRLGVDHWLGKGALPAQELLVGMIFYPLYIAR
ncbi:membrane protein [Pseudomonas sp. BAY1663]|nr:membrane protein [Pseudomonas sp. BAY1663]